MSGTAKSVPLSSSASSGQSDDPRPGALLPSTSVDFSGIEAASRFDALKDYLQGLITFEAVQSAPEVGAYQGRAWQVGPLFAHQYRRQSSRLIERAEAQVQDRLVLRIYRQGIGLNLQGETAHRAGPGYVHLYRLDSSFRWVTGDFDSLVLVLPYEAVGYDPSRDPGHLSFGFDTPNGRMLRATIETLFDTLPAATVDDSAALSSMVSGLVRGFATRDEITETDRASFERGRAAALHRYIEDNLGDPALGVPEICHAVGISRAALYRLFDAEGGVMRHIRRRRLERAFGDLCCAPAERGIVGEVAARWAFGDPAQFSRSFHAEFGHRPTDILAEGGHAVEFPTGTAGGQSGALSGRVALSGIFR